MASGAYHLVLRGISAIDPFAGLPRLRSPLQLSIQLLLRGAWAASAKGTARPPDAPEFDRRHGVQTLCRRPYAKAVAVGHFCRDRILGALGPCARGATSGALADGCASPFQPVADQAHL